MPFFQTVLPNGLTVLAEILPTARSVALGFFVNTGARDENEDEAGVSHFLEHMAFKGTARRTAWDVNRDFDRIGAAYNAYTSEENTVFYAVVLPEYLPQAMDILADILRPSLRQEDFDTEKQVILEEIKMYEDVPESVAWEHARKLYYDGHPLGHSVLGSLESIQALTREQMYAYFQRRYGAENIILSVAGPVSGEQIAQLAEKHCAAWFRGNSERTDRREWRRPPATYVLTREKVVQEHVMLFTAAPPADSPLRYACDILAMTLGDGTFSRLYWELVDPGHADSADCNYYEHDGSGCLHVSYSCEAEKTEANRERVQRILDDVQSHGITAEELQIAKNKIASRVARVSERPMGHMVSLARMWWATGSYHDLDTELRLYEAVQLEDIRTCLDLYPIQSCTVVAFGPATQLFGLTAQPV
ncbi:MAG: pitrilysin family protein [Thermogemmata sp.]|jgi:predicted Zn-dependent peptidase|uniref:Insulinase family protein n=1 Tax=Thermogemmata fonticola TaxID=2755323 RepID=A0A7V8VE52_9BACT|nr:pitrilysin family protein [Thermogemmata fonticola]MBA2226393.1 insulinase family protein [Thermogemmata fonticola]MCX8140148.1 insulinase family protein [Gemmataceae bacterium]